MNLSPNMIAHLQAAASQFIAHNTHRPGAYGITVSPSYGTHRRTLVALESRGLLERCREYGLADSMKITPEGFRAVLPYVQDLLDREEAEGRKNAASHWPGIAELGQIKVEGIGWIREFLQDFGM